MKGLLVALMLLLGGAAAAAPTSNLLEAAGVGPWTTFDWNAQSKSGQAARFDFEKDGVLHVSAPAPDDARFVREVPVEPGTVYHISAKIRTEGVGPDGRGAWVSATGIQEGSPEVRGNADRFVEFYGRTEPNQRKLSLTLGVGGYGALNNGSAWFRDLRIEPAADVPLGVKVVSLAPPEPKAGGGGGRSGWLFALLALVGVLLLVSGKLLKGRAAPVRKTAPPGAQARPLPLHLDRRDAALLTGLTVVCLGVSLWNLGGHVAPETGWKPGRAGESVTVEFGRPVNLSRIYYYAGINEAAGDGSRFSLSARDETGRFVPLQSFTKADTEVWKFLEVKARTDAVRLAAETPFGRLNELAFVEEGHRTPLTGLRIAPTSGSPADVGAPANLLDEQRAFEYTPSFRTGFYFDEIYFARTAWETLHAIEPYESTHPPLGKLLISAGIVLFGMNPFGWRIVGTLFGVALVPAMYLLALKLFRNRFYAFCGAFLLAVDFMRFAQTRVALIDSYALFFILLMYYFILDLFPGQGRPPERPERSMLLAGLAFGFGAASKWVAVYAGGGIMLLVAIRTVLDLDRKNYPRGLGAGGFLARRLGVFILAFGVIPGAVYLASYIPYFFVPGPGHDLPGILRYQQHMLEYHRTLHSTHPFSSPWWSWPLDLRPIWLYMGEGLPKGVVSSIASFGNPAIWWLTIPAVAGTALLAWRRRDGRLGVVLLGLAFQYLPWVGIQRMAFIYHFFTSVPFVILCAVALLQAAEERAREFRAVTWSYLAVAAGFFVVFYPVLSGMVVSEAYVEHLRWLPTWLF